jgi:hypothetical protein
MAGEGWYLWSRMLTIGPFSFAVIWKTRAAAPVLDGGLTADRYMPEPAKVIDKRERFRAETAG